MWCFLNGHLTSGSCVEHIIYSDILLHLPLHSYYYFIIIIYFLPSSKKQFFLSHFIPCYRSVRSVTYFNLKYFQIRLCPLNFYSSVLSYRQLFQPYWTVYNIIIFLCYRRETLLFILHVVRNLCTLSKFLAVKLLEEIWLHRRSALIIYEILRPRHLLDSEFRIE